ncbi:MAG: tRNA (guanosine(37)-N1)-methyltransferase TrmD [Myxococcales bacterium]|nr:tRNA (guanosine(37)-N1)-methyltransferase TrmD [Myxococcales bacterium]
MSGPVFEIFTLFPAAITGFFGEGGGIVGAAIREGRVQVCCTDLRDFTHDRHRTVDDTPYGGGPGMLIKAAPVVEALEHVAAQRGPMHRILLSPAAPTFDQRVAERLARIPRIALLCGRYEGIDDRVRERFVDESLSLGDFVLNGGEVAALAIVEAVARLCEGVVGNPESLHGESFGPAGAWLEPPHYTRPAEFRGLPVPDVLLRGHHADVERWRLEQSWARTWRLRPDLRPIRAWPADAAIYLGHPAGAEIGAVEGVHELHAVGPGERYSDLRALRRRLRRRHGQDPEFVALTRASADPDPGVYAGRPHTSSAPALLDLLHARRGDLGFPLVLWLDPEGDLVGEPGEKTHGAGLSAIPAEVSAIFSPAIDPGIELAPAAGMADSSHPRWRAIASLAVRTLSRPSPGTPA